MPNIDLMIGQAKKNVAFIFFQFFYEQLGVLDMYNQICFFNVFFIHNDTCFDDFMGTTNLMIRAPSLHLEQEGPLFVRHFLTACMHVFIADALIKFLRAQYDALTQFAGSMDFLSIVF